MRTLLRNKLFILLVAVIFMPAVYQLAFAEWAVPADLLETPTISPTVEETPGGTFTVTSAFTSTITPTSTATPQPTNTNTPQPTNTNTPQPTPSFTNTPQPTNTNTPLPPSTPTFTATPQPTNTNTPLPPATPTFTSTPQPTITATPMPSNTPTITVTPQPTNTGTPSPPTPTPPQPTATPTMPPGPTNTPTITPSPSPTSPPPFKIVYLPIFALNTYVGEPNDTCQQARTIVPSITYSFYPNDAVDWYQFDLNTSGNLTVRLSEFVPIAGQVAVYRGRNCDSIVFLGSNGDFTPLKVVNLGNQPAGKYYVFISNDGNFTNVTPYKLRVVFASGS